mmetsp:Transcript_5049/g.16265  ORF Transcript_5049/g.16265 Transcript_5049/m.16265 type:complete len:285 (+) Transcript_5049:64-918(+)
MRPAARLAALLLPLVALPSVTAASVTSRGTSQAASSDQRSAAAGRSFLRTLEFKHRLRICNAYPLNEAVDVYEENQKLTNESIPYKSCHEFTSPVTAGDQLQFKIGGVSAGSFAVSELPSSDAVLVLVIYRHDAVSTAVAFESHVFANLVNAQIAVLDTYRGGKKASLRVQDGLNATTSRSEELRFDSVVSVNQGVYEVVLQGEDGDMAAREELVALNRESYVVVRCGVEEEDGQGYPQEIIVYPNSDAKVLMGGASPGRGGPLLPTLLAAVLALALAAASSAA